MELTYAAGNKDLAKTEPHALELDPVPTLLLGSKPAGKNDGDTSVRTSSPVPSETPSTPSKGSGKARTAQVRKRCPSMWCPSPSIHVISSLRLKLETIGAYC